jgi:serine/threonine-protein kinase
MLGSGNMGATFLAEDEHGQQVAAKILHSHRTSVGLGKEAQILGLVGGKHRSLPLLHGVGHLEQDPGRPALIMEHVEGVNLGRMGPVSPGRAVRMIQEVVQGAGVLHREGWRHNDICTGNVLTNGHSSGTRLVDFGFASKLDREVRDGSRFAPPEQHAGTIGRSASPDLYAAGTLLTHLLTRRYPAAPSGHNAEEWLEIAHSIRGQRAVAPKRLKDVVRHAIALDPAARYQSAEEMNEALEPFSDLP